MLPADHIETELWSPHRPGELGRQQKSAEIKDAIEEAAVQLHGLIVSNRQIWDEAVVKICGNSWTLQAITGDGKTVARDGATARVLAQTLSMMPTAELRHFGLRFAGKNEPIPRKAGEGSNRSLDSGAVSGVLNGTVPLEERRRARSPEKDHFSGACAGGGDGPGTHGHTRDDDFHDGLEYGIGHGRRHIGTKDNLYAGVQISTDARDFPAQGRRFVRPKEAGVVTPDWTR